MLGKLFGKKEKKEGEQREGPRPLSTGITDSILNTLGNRAIPSMPAAAQKAFQLATDPSAEARDFVEVIESDEAMAARVIRIANSVYFHRGHDSTTIEQSINVIGINELRCLLNATSLTELFPSRHPLRTQFWTNDIATAIISREIAAKFLPEKSDIAFLAGLMHDIGKLVLLQRAEQLYLEATNKVIESGCSFSKAEGTIFVFDHTEVGQLVGEKWNFSGDLLSAIRDHHRSWSDLGTLKDSPSLAGVVKAADLISHSMGLGHQKGFVQFMNHSEEALGMVRSSMGLSSDDFKQDIERYQKAFELENEMYAQSA